MKNKSKLSTSLWAISIIALVASSFSSSVNLQGGKDWVVPESAKKLKNPVKSSDESVKAGKALYAKHCKSCHGTSGKGDGSKSKELNTSCGDFTLNDFQSQSDGAIYYKIREGRDDMPSYKKKITDEDDIWAIVNYIRTQDKSGNKEKPKTKVEEKRETPEISVKKTKEPEIKKEEKKKGIKKNETTTDIQDSIYIVEKTNIEFTLKYYEMALNASDTLAIIAPFDSNATFIPVQTSTVIGAAQIKEHYNHVFKTLKLNMVISMDAIELSNDFAFVRANMKGEQIFLADNHKAPMENALFMVMKKTKGIWKIYYYIYN